MSQTQTLTPGLLVLGVGNVLKGDDGVGPYVVARLQEQATQGRGIIESVDCGTSPENYTGLVRRLHPDMLVIVDAAEMGLAEGAMRTIPAEKAGSIGMSTHSMPLSLFVSYVSELAQQVVIVGIQPASTQFGREMSPAVREAGDRLTRLLLDGRLDGVPNLL